MGLKNVADRRPRGFDRVLSGEERPISDHGVAQQSLVRRFRPQKLLTQVELPLVADELLAGTLDAGGQGDRGVGGEPESQIVRRTGRRGGVAE